MEEQGSPLTLESIASAVGHSLPHAVDIREVGPRDGLQLERALTLDHKIRMIDGLVQAGVRRVEVTSFVSPTAVPALADAADLVQELYRWPDVDFCALVAGIGGAKRALAAGITHLEYVVSASESHAKANAGKTLAQSVEAGKEIINMVHEAGGICEVIVAISFDCPFEGPTPVGAVSDIVQALVAAGADRICLGDTIGTATPDRVISLVQAVRAQAPGHSIGLHLHNTRDTAMANVLAGLLIGVTDFDASIGGLGGCPFAPGASGNLATEDLTNFLEDMGIHTGLNIAALKKISSEVAEFVGHELSAALTRCEPRIGFTYTTDPYLVPTQH
ncbi:hydroxymethylglutaryl-CoA lyase [Arthrobacter sp. B6]|uniref:hydroxymethylglutaryl-CoA lyase n=1 Tax=Arthrobacter sp. B6 TaxID=1570137 RepID=UPI000831B8D3|nr:hydroxymethylglutaryl-CoA lyase [Arthrobacter sp. B6]